MGARCRHDRRLRHAGAPDRVCAPLIVTLTDELAWISSVNAGVEVVGISGPDHLIDVRHLTPQANVRGASRPIEMGEVDIDPRGLVYASNCSGPSCVAVGGRAVTWAAGRRVLGTGRFVRQPAGGRAGPTSN